MTRIVVDWGTSAFRAYRFHADGAIADQRHAAAGIATVTDGDFEAVLMREAGDWIDPGAEVLLSGMITSRNGWLETPYAETPAALSDLAASARELTAKNGARLRFLPGVCAREPSPDVMRGEEIQVFGAVEPGGAATLVLPGTHSKWVRVRDGRIAAFRTFLTGETFALLKGHSIVGRLIPPGERPPDREAFAAGVRQAFDAASAGALNDVFTARSGALLGAFTPEAIADRLSGILIGHELKAGLGLGWPTEAPMLVGDPALCRRYMEAFAVIGREARLGPDHAAAIGFGRLWGA